MAVNESTPINPINRDGAVAFLRRYTEGQKATAQHLAARGRLIGPCTCLYGGCTGWQMIPAAEGIDGIPVSDLIEEAFPR